MNFEQPEINNKSDEVLDFETKRNPTDLNESEATAYEYIKQRKPRAEYIRGQEKLDFHYVFSTGEVFDATEDEDGIASITIKREGKVIIDFKDFLKKQKFVTPTYLIKNEDHKLTSHNDIKGKWGVSFSMLTVGDVRDSKAIVSLLHEIAHAQDKKFHQRWNAIFGWGERTGPFKKEFYNERLDLVEEISDSERDAWAKAFKIARKTKEEYGINLLEGFESSDELKKIVYGSLISYRLSKGKKLISSDFGLFADIWGTFKQKFFGETHGAKQWKFMEELFDKNRLKR